MIIAFWKKSVAQPQSYDNVGRSTGGSHDEISAAAILLLAITVASASALASIVLGPGFGTPCAEGGCPVLGGSVNAIGAHSLDLFHSSNGPVDLNGFTLILAVPNNPANGLNANPIRGRSSMSL
jgi:hypothetical protein